MSSPTSSRLVSLDALRGFDMCWILGLANVVESLLKQFLPGSALTTFINNQFEHVDWEGYHFEDNIFPLFLFISGVSMAFAVPKRLETQSKAEVIGHLVLRALIIFGLGVIFSGGFSKGVDNVRWLGVIQRIGVASAIAGILSIYMDTRGLVIALVTCLIGYWLMLLLIPVPGIGAGHFAEGQNLTNYLDKIWLPGRKYDGDHDPEGILSNLPAVGTALLGVLAGQWLKRDLPASKKVMGLVVAGIALLVLGWCWHPFFPVVKKLWSSSFVLVAGGWACLMLALFYWIVDIQGLLSWCQPFVWVGANPLSLYLASGMGAFRTVSERLVGYPKGDWKWTASAVTFALMILTARWLYKRGIFLKA